MATNHKIRLREDQIRLLSRLPEQGMGYQVVDIDLRDGKTLMERVVLNSEFLRLKEDETIDPNDILSIHLHDQHSPPSSQRPYAYR